MDKIADDAKEKAGFPIADTRGISAFERALGRITADSRKATQSDGQFAAEKVNDVGAKG